MTKKIEHLWAALIAGGWGTRQFPLSNETRPKQFVRLDNFTFIQHTTKRLLKAGILPKHVVVVVTHEVQRRLALENLTPYGILSQNIIIIDTNHGFEGAATVAAEFIHKIDDKAYVLSTPTDHAVRDTDGFAEAIKDMFEFVKETKQMAILGKEITDQGMFMECGHAEFDSDDNSIYKRVVNFVEKPDHKLADRMMRKGNTLCYTGVRICHAGTFLKSATKHGLIAGPLPTDKLMKTIPNIFVFEGKFDWADCGTLDALWGYSKKTPNHRNAVHGEGFDCERLDCRESFMHSVEGVNLICTDIRNQVVAYEIISDVDTDEPHNFLLVAERKHSHLAKHLAEMFSKSKHLLPRVFTVWPETGEVTETGFDQEHPNGNRILKSNVSDTISYGFIGSKNLDILAHQRRDGIIDVFVTQRKK